MMMNHRGSLRAKQLLDDIGFNEITDFPMNLLVSGLWGYTD